VVLSPQPFQDIASFKGNPHLFSTLLPARLAPANVRGKPRGLLRTTGCKEAIAEVIQIPKHCLMTSLWNPTMKG
jgi:hypothetical protein